MKARFTPEAENDLEQAIGWYDEAREGLGDEFLLSIDECVKYVEAYPEMYATIHGQMRRAMVPRFPYGLIYEIEPPDIVIYAVFHCARDPKQWKRRRKLADSQARRHRRQTRR